MCGGLSKTHPRLAHPLFWASDTLLFRSRGSLGYPLCFALSSRRDGVEDCLDKERRIAVRRDILDDRSNTKGAVHKLAIMLRLTVETATFDCSRL
jgi:hypothetical protein